MLSVDSEICAGFRGLPSNRACSKRDGSHRLSSSQAPFVETLSNPKFNSTSPLGCRSSVHRVRRSRRRKLSASACRSEHAPNHILNRSFSPPLHILCDLPSCLQPAFLNHHVDEFNSTILDRLPGSTGT